MTQQSGMTGGVPHNEWKKQYRAARIHEPRFFISERISNWRRKTPGSDLTTDYLFELYNEQEELCFYTGNKMVVGAKHADPLGLSLDRLYPEKGYIQGNVVWCTYFINTAKGILNVQEFCDLIGNIHSRLDLITYTCQR